MRSYDAGLGKFLTSDNLRVYRFDGTNWAQVGNNLNISGTQAPALTAMNGADVAFADSGGGVLRIYRFDGSDWAQAGDAAGQIGPVVEVIKRIAAQTNLLALNATIEAVSAGAAGKGFAVVANEIKELARQSNDAAGEISTGIDDIQNKTGEAVQVISEGAKIIGTINEKVTVISTAVNQQTSAANEISANVAQAASEANEVSSNIQGVNQVVGQNEDNIAQVNTSASEMAGIADDLKDMVGHFKVA